MTTKVFVSLLVLALAGASAHGRQSADPHRNWKHELKKIIDDNRRFVREHGTGYFSQMIESQHPYATVVSCVDSRVHTHAFDQTPDNDIFMVRNLGNQLGVANGAAQHGMTTGAADYGVLVLKTPLLIIIGHDKCGAVKAASYAHELNGIAKNPQLANVALEIQNLHVMLSQNAPPADAKDLVQRNIVRNIHHQVDLARARYADLVAAGKLKIIGALYDLAGAEDSPPPDFHKRYGRLIIKNIDGEKDPQVIHKMVEEISPSYDKIGTYSKGE